MVQLYYRGMAATDGKPKLGRSARLLGIRPSVDIDVSHMLQGWLNAQGYLHPEAERDDSGVEVEVAIRNTKGMSTSLSIEGLPAFRKPKAFGETGRDPLWQIDSKYIKGDLALGGEAPIRLGLKVARLTGSKPTKGVDRSLKAQNIEPHSQIVPLVDSPRLAMGFEPGAGFSPMTNIGARSQLREI